jgi:hypothetical protein
MAEKQRYTVSVPDHISDELEKHSKAVKATPTEYATDVLKWWYGLGCPPVRPDEIELKKRFGRLKPVPANFNIWELAAGDFYELIDEPAETALQQLGLPNLFAREKEHEKVRIMIAFDNHPTHWLVFNFFKGGKTAAENGLAFSAYPKNAINRDDMLFRLSLEAKKMDAKGPIVFSQIPKPTVKEMPQNTAKQ